MPSKSIHPFAGFDAARCITSERFSVNVSRRFTRYDTIPLNVSDESFVSYLLEMQPTYDGEKYGSVNNNWYGMHTGNKQS
ncbi:hypothetical protein BofuT4_uP109930.1 [Botrytis cinerea T4]|uniref:Uncharacterized protein n=1 Tax=Botryotinia fuckeliana (strain T4) TaxID=999810 RepID=G2Y7K7_BOTF4|nr:hypothetical protein BofuT4_uP109930.1 [Botrytis cinerea T4]